MTTLAISDITFEVRRSDRRKTLAITVDRSGELLLHAPTTTPEDELIRWASTKLLWVHQKLALKAALAPKVREPEYVSGESFMYLGRSYRLQLMRDQAEPLCFNGQRFTLRPDARADAAEHFRRWYIATGKPWLAQRVASLTRKIGATPTRLDLRDLGYRWGSCGQTGVLYFNWKTLQLPVRLIDYVIAHELAHLLEPNHQPAFWRLLDYALPDWKERQNQLKIQARLIYWCHPEMGQ